MFWDGWGFSWRLTTHAVQAPCRVNSHYGDFTDLPWFLRTMSKLFPGKYVHFVSSLKHACTEHIGGSLASSSIFVTWIHCIVVHCWPHSMYSLLYVHFKFLIVTSCIFTCMNTCSHAVKSCSQKQTVLLFMVCQLYIRSLDFCFCLFDLVAGKSCVGFFFFFFLYLAYFSTTLK